MTFGNQSLESRPVRASVGALLVLSSALLAACSGTTGSPGPAGAPGATGPAGPSGTSGGALVVTTATAITGTITSVAISGPPVVQFKLADENGVSLKGLPAADLGWVFAQLVPGQNGLSSVWNSYIYTTVTPSGCPDGVATCDTTPKTQATVESATSGTLVDHGDGTYQYTFKTNITNVPNVTYNAALTHRVGFEIRGLAQANNASYTFQPSTGATTGIFEDEIVETATCDNCHTMLNAHGGARVEVQYCVMCHNPGTTDPYSGNPLDFKVMIHKIHTGNTLPSIQTPSGPNTTPTLGIGYWIIGHMESMNNFNTVLYPQDTRNCTTCHAQNIPAATQATEYYTVPSAEACGACHDTVNFATGLNHSAANIVANDTQCSTCHGPSSTIDNGQLQVITAHAIPANVEAANFRYLVNNVTFQTTAAEDLSGGELLGGQSKQQQCALQHPHGRGFCWHRSEHRQARLRRRNGPPRDRYRLGHERLHQLGERCDARTMGPADFLKPALRLRHRHACAGADRPGFDGGVHDGLADPVAQSARRQLPAGRRHRMPGHCQRRRRYRGSSGGRPDQRRRGHRDPRDERGRLRQRRGRCAGRAAHRRDQRAMRRLPQPALAARDQSQQQHSDLRRLPQSRFDGCE